MDEQYDEQYEDRHPLVHLTKEQLLLASGTMLTATGVDLLAHLGSAGLVVGGLLAFAAARHGQGLCAQLKGVCSCPPRPGAAEVKFASAVRGEPEEPSLVIPHAPPFGQMCHLLTRERLVLFDTAPGPASSGIDALLT